MTHAPTPDGPGGIPVICPNCGVMSGAGWRVAVTEPRPGAVLTEDSRCVRCDHPFWTDAPDGGE